MYTRTYIYVHAVFDVSWPLEPRSTRQENCIENREKKKQKRYRRRSPHCYCKPCPVQHRRYGMPWMKKSVSLKKTWAHVLGQRFQGCVADKEKGDGAITKYRESCTLCGKAATAAFCTSSGFLCSFVSLTTHVTVHFSCWSEKNNCFFFLFFCRDDVSWSLQELKPPEKSEVWKRNSESSKK